MLLPQTAEYALRAVTALALLPRDLSASAMNISEQSGVPLPYLSKILKRLVQANLLLGKKGPGGGFKFNKTLDKINLLAVLKAVNYEFDENHCAFGWDKCNGKKPCPLHDVFTQLKNDYYNWASETTLAMIVAKKSNRKPSC